MKIATKKLSDLQPAEYNPRQISDSAMTGLRASIERFGLVEPIVWNKQTGNVVGGHQRLKVLEEQGIKKTEVVVIDIEESEERALNVTLNNPGIVGEFTIGLQEVLSEIKLDIGDDKYTELRLDKLEIDQSFDPNNEWKGMPEFESENLMPYRSIIVSFSSEENVQAFAELIDQKITDKTKSLRFPFVEIDKVVDLRYVDSKE